MLFLGIRSFKLNAIKSDDSKLQNQIIDVLTQ